MTDDAHRTTKDHFTVQINDWEIQCLVAGRDVEIETDGFVATIEPRDDPVAAERLRMVKRLVEQLADMEPNR